MPLRVKHNILLFDQKNRAKKRLFRKHQNYWKRMAKRFLRHPSRRQLLTLEAMLFALGAYHGKIGHSWPAQGMPQLRAGLVPSLRSG